MRSPKWTPKEIARIDTAKSAVERKFGVSVRELHTRFVKDLEILLQHGKSGEFYRYLTFPGAARVQTFDKGIWVDTIPGRRT